MDESKEFTTCPVCELRRGIQYFITRMASGPNDIPLGFEEQSNRTGLNRLCEGMANEVKGRGLARQEWNLNLQTLEAVAVDPARDHVIPVGSELPAMRVQLDICTDCGVVYATRYYRGSAKKEAPVMKAHKIFVGNYKTEEVENGAMSYLWWNW